MSSRNFIVMDFTYNGGVVKNVNSLNIIHYIELTAAKQIPGGPLTTMVYVSGDLVEEVD